MTALSAPKVSGVAADVSVFVEGGKNVNVAASAKLNNEHVSAA